MTWTERTKPTTNWIETGDFLLKEDGKFLLLESGDNILREILPATWTDRTKPTTNWT